MGCAWCSRSDRGTAALLRFASIPRTGVPGVVLALAVVLALLPCQVRAGDPADAELRCDTSPLSMAASGDVRGLKRLLSQGMTPIERTEEGFTALICASDAGATDAVKLLLEHGADPNACTEQQNLCPLWYAAMGNHARVCSLLIDAGASLEALNGWNANTALAWAVRTGKEDAVRVLIETGASLEPVVEEDYHGGRTALEWAKKVGHRAVVEMVEAATRERAK